MEVKIGGGGGAGKLTQKEVVGAGKFEHQSWSWEIGAGRLDKGSWSGERRT